MILLKKPDIIEAVNGKNKIFNDNIYEFEELGIPFLSALGREIFNELNQ